MGRGRSHKLRPLTQKSFKNCLKTGNKSPYTWDQSRERLYRNSSTPISKCRNKQDSNGAIWMYHIQLQQIYTPCRTCVYSDAIVWQRCVFISHYISVQVNHRKSPEICSRFRGTSRSHVSQR